MPRRIGDGNEAFSVAVPNDWRLGRSKRESTWKSGKRFQIAVPRQERSIRAQREEIGFEVAVEIGAYHFASERSSCIHAAHVTLRVDEMNAAHRIGNYNF